MSEAAVAEELQKEPQEESPKKPSRQLVVRDDGEFANWLDTARFNQSWRIAQVFADSQMVPDHFKGDPASCMVAIQMAFRLDVDPMMFLQKSYIVGGKPGIEATLAIGLVNKRGPFTGPIQWKFEGEGESRKCTAYATHKVTGELCEMPLGWDTVEKEGWASKNGSKW
ncbi:MAG: hypothetical protein JRJ59_11960, partial [Deltaproteobacteria bacterium]|nr:hypothetical protein [Deltaproteobacteria bacterium]